MCISIYGPSIRKNPHTHIHHPVLRITARHDRLPSSLSGKHPRLSHTLPPTVTDPPPPAPLRTLVRQKTLAIAHYFIYIHIYSFTPLPLQSRKASDASIYICLHPLTSSQRPCGSPDPDGPTRARSVHNRKFKVVAGSARPLHTRQRSERRSGRPGRPTTPRIPTDTRTGSILPWPNNPLVRDTNPSTRTTADAASTA